MVPPDGAPDRHLGRAMWRGFRGRCPNCGQGRMFRAFLKVADSCKNCGEDLHHHRADDAPAYFVILIVGHVVVPLALSVEVALRAALLVARRAVGPAHARPRRSACCSRSRAQSSLGNGRTACMDSIGTPSAKSTPRWTEKPMTETSR